MGQDANSDGFFNTVVSGNCNLRISRASLQTTVLVVSQVVTAYVISHTLDIFSFFSQVGFVNSLQFSNAGHFLVAGIGQEHRYSAMSFCLTAFQYMFLEVLA